MGLVAVTEGHGPNRELPGVLHGATVVWLAPTIQQTRIGWEEFRHSAGGEAEFKETHKEIWYRTGGRVIFRSLDEPDNARGLTADGVVMDEASLILSRAYYEVVRPMISDTNGWVLMMGTPKGRNWFWQEWIRAKDERASNSWAVPTLGVAIQGEQLVRAPHPMENPTFPFEEALSIWRQTPERIFSQEFLAEFIEESGAVFRKVDESAVAIQQQKAVPGGIYMIGVDWARHNDFTVYAVVECRTASLVFLDRFRDIDFHTQVQRLRALNERFQPMSIIAEDNAMGLPVVEQVQRLGLPVRAFHTTAESKRFAIETLANAFERGVIKVLNDEALIAELKAFAMDRLPSGAFRYGAPEGMHDDTVIALALAWSAALPAEMTNAEVIVGMQSREMPW